MQGSGMSSLDIWTPFDTMTTADSRNMAWSLKIAWQRVQDDSLNFAIVGTSIVDGVDIVQGQGTNLTLSDYFSYNDESDYAMRLEYDRLVYEPLGGISLAQADVILDNTNLRFTPHFSQTIGTAIEPNRPLQMSIGFLVESQNKVIPIIKGLTEKPMEDKFSRKVSIHAYDYIEFLNQFPLESTIYTAQRSDQIIAAILADAGYGSSQYDLDEGLNTIGFAWFEKGQTAGERIRRICEGEGAHFYQDELGILRFENRRHYTESPHDTLQWTIDPDDIIDWGQDTSTPIINRCIVISNPRTVQDSIEVWKNGVIEELERGEVLTVWAKFDDPCTSFTSPVATTDYVANTKSDGSGDNKTADISIVFTGFTKDARYVITNNADEKVYVTLLRLRGTPATSDGEILQVYDDTDSQDKYDIQELIIENDFIDSGAFARYLATTTVTRYKDPDSRLNILIRGIPQLQLKDKIRVKDKDLGTYTNYRVMRIIGKLSPGEFTQQLTLRTIDDYEADNWAIVGLATVDNDNEFVGI